MALTPTALTLAATFDGATHTKEAKISGVELPKLERRSGLRQRGFCCTDRRNAGSRLGRWGTMNTDERQHALKAAYLKLNTSKARASLG
jgi:hypothetical protein